MVFPHRPKILKRILSVTLGLNLLATPHLEAQLALQVLNLNDAGPGSLREAIQRANAVGGGVIDLTSQRGMISLDTGELLLDSNLTLRGPGPTLLSVHGSSKSRVLKVTGKSSGSLISGISIQGGFGAEGGGGIDNDGALTVVDCIVEKNSAYAFGSSFTFPFLGGAGIYNRGLLVVRATIIRDNVASGNAVGDPGQPGSHGGSGAGICNTGTVFFDSCSIYRNLAGSAPKPFFTRAGHGGSGGGLYNIGTASLYACSIVSNSCGNGPRGWGGEYVDGGGTTGGFGGTGGSGGGIYSDGTLSLTNCTIYGNAAGLAGDGAEGGPAIYARELTGSGGSGGNAGDGGGIYAVGRLSLCNCTITANTTSPGGSGGPPGEDFSLNRDAIYGQPGNQGKSGQGAGLAGVGELLNTLIAENFSAAASGTDVFGRFTSRGYNLIGAPDGAESFGGFGDLVGRRPELGPLLDHGGRTPTCALLDNSPAIDAGSDEVLRSPWFLRTDQRGTSRIKGRHVDIGAFEADPLPTLAISGAGGRTLIISWPSPSTGFVLQTAPAFGNGLTQWSDVPQPPISLDGRQEVTVIANGFSSWFRLRKP